MVLMGRAPHKAAFDRDTEEDYRIAEDALRRVDMLEFKDWSFMTLLALIMLFSFCACGSSEPTDIKKEDHKTETPIEIKKPEEKKDTPQVTATAEGTETSKETETDKGKTDTENLGKPQSAAVYTNADV